MTKNPTVLTSVIKFNTQSLDYKFRITLNVGIGVWDSDETEFLIKTLDDDMILKYQKKSGFLKNKFAYLKFHLEHFKKRWEYIKQYESLKKQIYLFEYQPTAVSNYTIPCFETKLAGIGGLPDDVKTLDEFLEKQYRLFCEVK